MMSPKWEISAVDANQERRDSRIERSRDAVRAWQTWSINGEEPQSMPSTLVLDPPDIDEAAAPGHVRQMCNDNEVASLRPDDGNLGPDSPKAQVASPLLTIPLELRLEIYHQALCYDYRLRAKLRYLLPPSFRCRDPLGLPTDDTGLLRVCQQIYNEALNVFYEVNVFSLHSKMLTPGSLDNLHHLRHVDFDFTLNYSKTPAGSARLQLAKELRRFVAICPRLRTFTLFGTPTDCFTDLDTNAGNEIVQALISLKASDTLEGLHLVLPFVSPVAWSWVYDFLDLVAPAAHWSCVLERLSRGKVTLSGFWQAKAYISPAEHKFREGFLKIDNKESRAIGFRYVASTENLEDWIDFPKEYEFQ